MATSARNLIDPARAALVALRGAFARAVREDRAAFESGHVAEARVLVSGYQLEAGAELGTWRFTLDAGLDGSASTLFSWPRPTPAYAPGDYTLLASWLSEALKDDGSKAIDSTLLVIWGHGAGVAIDPQFLTALRETAAPATKAGSTAPIDIIVLDSCLMASIELASEFQPLTRYLVASQTLVDLEPGGAPGVNLGEIASAFLARDAWRTTEEPKSGSYRHVEAAANSIVNIIGDSRSGAQQLTLFQLGSLGAAGAEPEMNALVALELADLPDELTHLSVAGLLTLFSKLLLDAATDSAERSRLLEAFRRAAFLRVRQFIDLQDLARQVHQRSRAVRLQLVALALIHALEPSPRGLILRNRTVVPAGLDRRRFSGVTIYCPWFLADIDVLEAPAFNVLADHKAYGLLECPKTTGWAKFVLGSLFEATAAERRASDSKLEEPTLERAALLNLLQSIKGCTCAEHHATPRPTRTTLWDNKPSGTSSGPRGNGIIVFGSPTFDDAFYPS